MTTTTDTATITEVVDRYLAAYNETDAATRLGLLETAFMPDATLADPPLDGTGHAGISEMMGVVHQHYPGHTFRRATGVEAHHGHFRYRWELAGPDGATVLTGEDVGVIAPDGRLARVTGFFEPLPELETA